MPIPFLAIAGLGVLGLAGAGKSIKAGIDNSDAKDNNEIARQNVDRAKKEAELARERCQISIQQLGERKVELLDVEVKRFVKAFEKIKNIELENSQGLEELQKFKADKISFGKLRELSDMATSLAQGIAGGTALGALTAFGAYNGAMLFASASTGTAISALGGAAATNATLAWFGGGSLAAGGLGMAGGTMVLGGLVAAPALLVLGIVAGSKASANLEKSYANLAKSREFAEEMKTVRTLCLGIRLRANMFERLLIRLNGYFQPSVKALENLVDTRGEDFRTYTLEEKQIVASSVAIAQAIKAVLDTPILTEEGVLTEESESLALQMQEKLSVFRDQ